MANHITQIVTTTYLRVRIICSMVVLEYKEIICSSGNDGLFWRGSQTKFRDITDGTTYTVMIAETLFGDRNPNTTTLINPQRQMKRVSGGGACDVDSDVLVNQAATYYEGRRAGGWIRNTGL